MRATIDAAGRLVIPKALREGIGLADGGEVEIELTDGALLIAPPTVRKRVDDRDGRAVIVTDEDTDIAPLADHIVRDVLDGIRR